jgi:hypothetical protein
VTGAYAELVELAERELELVHVGELELAERLQARRAAVVAELPATPPAEARPLLEAAAEIQRKTEAALQRDIAQAAAELSSIRRGRHAVQAYTPPAAAAGEHRSVDSAG